jgi:hypothetical protein
MGMFWRRDPSPAAEPIRWTTVAVALHQPEAEMLQGMLEAEGIPVMIRRTTIDVPEMLAGGPRGVMVLEKDAHEARQVLGLDEDMQPVS